MLDGFELFMRIMENILKSKTVDANRMAQYLWQKLTPSFKRSCMWITSSRYHLSSETAMRLFAQMIQSPFDADVWKDIWDNTTDEFQKRWVSSEETEIDKLVDLFCKECNLYWQCFVRFE